MKTTHPEQAFNLSWPNIPYKLPNHIDEAAALID